MRNILKLVLFETLLVEQDRINDIIEIGKTIIVEPIYFVNLYVFKGNQYITD